MSYICDRTGRWHRAEDVKSPRYGLNGRSSTLVTTRCNPSEYVETERVEEAPPADALRCATCDAT